MILVLKATLMMKQPWKSSTAWDYLRISMGEKQDIRIRLNNTGYIPVDTTHFKICFVKA